MAGVDTRKVVETLGLTKGEERMLRRATGLNYTEPRGSLERILYRPLTSVGVFIALIVIAIGITILVIISLWVPTFDKLIDTIFPVVIILSIVDQFRRDRLINKLYRAVVGDAARRNNEGAEQEAQGTE